MDIPDIHTAGSTTEIEWRDILRRRLFCCHHGHPSAASLWRPQHLSKSVFQGITKGHNGRGAKDTWHRVRSYLFLSCPFISMHAGWWGVCVCGYDAERDHSPRLFSLSLPLSPFVRSHGAFLITGGTARLNERERRERLCAKRPGMACVFSLSCSLALSLTRTGPCKNCVVPSCKVCVEQTQRERREKKARPVSLSRTHTHARGHQPLRGELFRRTATQQQQRWHLRWAYLYLCVCVQQARPLPQREVLLLGHVSASFNDCAPIDGSVASSSLLLYT